MKYGYFDKKNREYVITRPDTPTPWINYLGCDDYCALISNTAGGYSFHKDPRDKRITRYRYNGVPTDRPGKYIYIRDNRSKDFWSATWQPVLKDTKYYKYECRHGMGYTTMRSRYSGISTAVTYFVPLQENLELWMFTVKNKSKKKRDLSLFTYVEFCLWHAVMDMTDFQYTLNISKADCKDGVIYHNTGFYPRAGRHNLAYFASSQKVRGFDCDREIFIGPYNSETNPAAVMRGRSFGSISSGGNPIGSLWSSFALKPGEEKKVVFVLGVTDSMRESRQMITKYRDYEKAEKELDTLKRYWNEYLTHYVAETPDAEVDLMVNTWNQYQCRTTFNWSRSASYYESGIGRGMGFRDSNQDTLGVMHAIPERTKVRIKELLQNQFKDGSSYHQFFPLTKKGEKGGYSDDPLWLIVSATAYVKETGDTDFLLERIPYADSREAETVYEHLKKAIDYTYLKRGPHGFPLIGFADWNDCLNLAGENGNAESVWVAQFLHYACLEVIRLAELLEEKKDAAHFTEIAKRVKEDLNTTAWDGGWYVRAYDDDGNPVGSSKNREGKIDLLTQSWAVMSGTADNKRSVKCMDMVKKMLDSDHGIMLIAPAYTEYDPKIGAIGTFAPGLKENGGIFCHANPWAMIAEAILGRDDRAFAYYKKIAPATRNRIADIHKTEPYIYSQYIAGRDHKEHGRARNSWLTGSAAWNLVAITNYILGVRADYGGLIVDPCVPKSWKTFSVTRRFRGATYKIRILNPKRVPKGIRSIEVDGKKVRNNVIPPFSDGKTHQVKVIMGKA